MDKPLTIVVVGASGDLATRKIFPALFALFSRGLLPARVSFVGFARSPMSDEAFRALLTQNLTCRYVPGESCADWMARFLARCRYFAGAYDSPESFLDLYQSVRTGEKGPARRVYYLAIPPSVFLDTARSIGAAGLVSCDRGEAWSRVVIEKPFGRDRASSDELASGLAQVFTEDQTYRIDHYLGKEVIQNLMTLRFMNAIFEPLWSRQHIESVRIDWKEDDGVRDRGRYFDQYGIVRDVMQNHLLQMLALVAMEEPAGPGGQAIRDEKVRVLQAVRPAAAGEAALGQYGASADGSRRAYRAERFVDPASRTPTYGAAVLHVENARWAGVPFLVTAGKALEARETLIRIRFRRRRSRYAGPLADSLPGNDLVLRVQPDEAVYYTVVNKAPGLEFAVARTRLDLRYKAAFAEPIPDAYERLLMDVIAGDKGLFIRSDELAAAWDIFTPLLRGIDSSGLVPEPYPFGSEGPAAVGALASRYGIPAGAAEEREGWRMAVRPQTGRATEA